MSGSNQVIMRKSREIIKVYLLRIMTILVSTSVLLLVNGNVLLEIMAVNRVLSTVIILSFLLGVFLCCRNFYRLKWDFKVLCDLDDLLFVRKDSVALKQYQGKTYLTSELYLRLEASVEFDQSGTMISGLKPSATRSLIDIVKNAVVERRALMGYFSNLQIYLGLLGTFIGLFATVGSITNLIGFLAAGLSGEEDLAKMLVILIQQLEEPLSGMGIAFGTSLAGLCGSIVISALAMNVNRASALFAKIYSDWLIEFSFSDSKKQEQSPAKKLTSPETGTPGSVQATTDHLDTRLEQLAAIEERQLSLIETMAAGYREQSEAIQQLLKHQDIASLCTAIERRGEQLIQLGHQMAGELEAQRTLQSQQLENQQTSQNQLNRLSNEMFNLNQQGEQSNRTLEAILSQIQQLPDSLNSATAEQVEQATNALPQRVSGLLIRYIRRLYRLGRKDNRRQVDTLVETVNESAAWVSRANEKQLEKQIEAVHQKQNTLALRLLRGIHRLYQRSLRRDK